MSGFVYGWSVCECEWDAVTVAGAEAGRSISHVISIVCDHVRVGLILKAYEFRVMSRRSYQSPRSYINRRVSHCSAS